MDGLQTPSVVCRFCVIIFYLSAFGHMVLWRGDISTIDGCLSSPINHICWLYMLIYQQNKISLVYGVHRLLKIFAAMELWVCDYTFLCPTCELKIYCLYVNVNIQVCRQVLTFMHIFIYEMHASKSHLTDKCPLIGKCDDS